MIDHPEGKDLAASNATTELVKSYLKKINEALEQGDATEHTHRPALKDLIEGLSTDITAVNEPKRVNCGAPDYAVKKRNLSIGYIEAKDVGKSLDEAEDSDQLERYKKSLHNLILTDYLEFRWYVDGELRGKTRLAKQSKGSKIISNENGIKETIDILNDFISHNPALITNPKELSQRLARLAHIIREIIVMAFNNGNASNDLKDMRDAFAQVLIPDLNQPERTTDFADMYAQTLVYGLFAARVNHKGPEQFQRLSAAREIPKTNPFLKKLFENITGSTLDDEPYVDFVEDLTQTLANTDIKKVLEDFGTRRKQKDPIVHFYETFLEAYDPDLREKRGVFFTPDPAVYYIARSVDHILKTHFGLEGGLAHTSDIVEYDREEFFLDENGKPDRSKLLKTVQEARPKVLMLDPTCGTGTFLYAIMDLIRAEFMKRGDAGLWSAYVRDHLLPRIFGFELLMAPYAIAHFKLGMLLAGYDLPKEFQKYWQYDFEDDERLGIYLTNTLEEAPSEWQKLFGSYRILSEEANAASRIKRDLPIMVVLGNPPYSGHSSNKGEWINNLIEDYKKGCSDLYKPAQAKWLHDDYVKFIRWGQWQIEKTGYGVLALITNHSFLDNPTFRCMRRSLMESFNEIYIYDLHGNSKKKERSPDGSKDENIFDIQQGVAISIFIKHRDKDKPTKVFHADLWGLREFKYEVLSSTCVADTKWTQLSPQQPYYLFIPQNIDLKIEYDQQWSIPDIMALNGDPAPGIVTTHDRFAISWTKEDAINKVNSFLRTTSESDARELFRLCRQSQWNYDRAKKDLADGSWKTQIYPILYRPFDTRTIIYNSNIAVHRRERVMGQMLAGKNLALITVRKAPPSSLFNYFLATRQIIVNGTIRSDNQSIDSLFPLYLYLNSDDRKSIQKNLSGELFWSPGIGDRIPNLSPLFISKMEEHLKCKFVSDGYGDLVSTFGPEDVFHFIYAIFYSPTYRNRYSDFLKTEFPRVPLTSSLDLFRKLCVLGSELVTLHLLESPELSKLITRYPVPGNNQVEKGYPKYVIYEAGEAGYVYINKEQYFEGVPKEVWEFHVGAYQVCEKWLKARKGRQLSYEDLTHYQKVIVVLNETIRLMEEIDQTIPEWPIK